MLNNVCKRLLECLYGWQPKLSELRRLASGVQVFPSVIGRGSYHEQETCFTNCR